MSRNLNVKLRDVNKHLKNLKYYQRLATTFQIYNQRSPFYNFSNKNFRKHKNPSRGGCQSQPDLADCQQSTSTVSKYLNRSLTSASTPRNPLLWGGSGQPNWPLLWKDLYLLQDLLRSKQMGGVSVFTVADASMSKHMSAINPCVRVRQKLRLWSVLAESQFVCSRWGDVWVECVECS